MRNHNTSKLLIDDRPLIVLPSLAQAIGLNEAIVLQQVHYWLRQFGSTDNRDHFHDGRWWVYNTAEGWQKNFPFWSVSTVKRTIRSLREKGLLVVGRYNKAAYDQTLWYTVNYDNVDKLEDPIESTCTDREGQNDTIERVRVSQPIPEITPEITPETTAPAAQTPTALSGNGSKDQDPREEQRSIKITTRKGKRLIAELHGAERVYGTTALRVYPTLDDHVPEVEVAEIWLEPEDTQLTCPHCDHSQPWPQSAGMRRRASSLICQVGEGGPMDGCGTYFIVHAYKSSGARFTYQLAIPKPQWVVTLHGIKWHTTEDEARLFLSNWDEDVKFLLEKFKWATAPETGMIRTWKREEVVIQRVNAAYATGMKKRAARQAERERPAGSTEVLVDLKTGQTYVEEGLY